jgi:hypothetical protein
MNRNLYYLSFGGDEGWRGGCYIYAKSPTDAVREAWRMKINPGGEVAFWEVPVVEKTHQYHLKPMDDIINKLIICKRELESVAGPIACVGDIRKASLVCKCPKCTEEANVRSHLHVQLDPEPSGDRPPDPELP